MIEIIALAVAVLALAASAGLGFIALRLKRKNSSLIEALAENDSDDPNAWRRDVL
jgi:hypothetical protein